MQCREFREISEAYINDELLVETCIQIAGHLENCQRCREDLAAKRELRQQVRAAVRNSNEFQMDPIFARRLHANLRETAFGVNSRRGFFSTNRLLIPAMASILLAITLGFLLLDRPNKTADHAAAPDRITNDLTEISLKAVGDHKDCALEKLQQWEKMSKLDYAEKAVYTEKVAKPLQANLSENIEMLHAHKCIFEGKEFTHVILRRNGHIVSVFFDQDNAAPSSGVLPNSNITSETEGGMQVASFNETTGTVFVVSDLTEIENLAMARTLYNSWLDDRI